MKQRKFRIQFKGLKEWICKRVGISKYDIDSW